MVEEAEHEVIVVGGGPAGATAGALLAEKGRRVLILEKESFPRYKVGESLIPFCYPVLERLQLIKPLIRSAFPKKYSVQFVSTSGKISKPFYFYQHIKHSLARSWQVVRSEFDAMILDRARALGAEVREQTAARSLVWEGEACRGVVARGPDGEDRILRAKIVVDASGRDGLAVRSQGWRRPDPQLQKVAVWTYYKGAKRDEGLDEGATTVAYVPKKGWFWYIPLPDDLVSVGIVAEGDELYAEGRDPEAIFKREIQRNAWIRDHLSCGERVRDFRVTGDYSYRSQHCAADGLVLVGDAFAFLDPVFSSGVFLALKSGALAADAIDAALAADDLRASRFEAYGQELCHGIEAMRRLVYAFYDEGFNFGMVLRKHPHLRSDLTDCLIGNLDRDFTELWDAVAEFAELPPELDYGQPAAAPAVKAEG